MRTSRSKAARFSSGNAVRTPFRVARHWRKIASAKGAILQTVPAQQVKHPILVQAVADKITHTHSFHTSTSASSALPHPMPTEDILQKQRSMYACARIERLVTQMTRPRHREKECVESMMHLLQM